MDCATASGRVTMESEPMIRPAAVLLLAPLAMTAQSVAINAGALKLFRPLPAVVSSEANPVTEAKAALGRALFLDPRLSRDRNISCNTCHPLDRYGADGTPVSTGHKGQKGARNSPTVYNAAGHIAQFWDGRAATVEEQAAGPVLNPEEMGMPSAGEVAGVLRSIAEYREMFRRAFPGEADPATFDNLGRAIGAFERRLLTPARRGRYLQGGGGALAGAGKGGVKRFVAPGCAACHYGPYLGGNAFQKAGMVRPWPKTADTGRFQVTGKESDRYVFKVPSLRNVTRTAPYFHDGSEASLGGAIQIMARHQVGRNLAEADVRGIAAFLEALTGELPLNVR